MKKFKFNLQSILEYRQSIEDRERQLLSKARERLEMEEDRARQLDDEKDKHLRSFAGGPTNIKRLQQQENYLASLDLRRQQQQQQVDDARMVSDTMMDRVVTATSNRRILEGLKERNFAEYTLSLSRMEQKFLDEVGIIAYCHKEMDERR